MSERQNALPHKVHVEVLEDDIRKGKPDNPCYCPVALATRRALAKMGLDQYFKDEAQSLINVGYVLGTFPPEQEAMPVMVNGIVYKAPKSVNEFVGRFDSWYENELIEMDEDDVDPTTEFQPFEFDMEVLSDVQA